MTRKRFSEEAALDLLRRIDLDLASGSTVERDTYCRDQRGDVL